MGPALDQSCSGTFSACVAWVWHTECQTWQYIPNPRGATQNLKVRSCCWRHHRAESQRAEESSGHSPANLMPTTYFTVLEGALHGTRITCHHQLKKKQVKSWASEVLSECVLFDMRQLCQGVKNMIHTKLAKPFPWVRIRKANLLLSKHKQVFTSVWNIEKTKQNHNNRRLVMSASSSWIFIQWYSSLIETSYWD